jgi:predicted transcriptional regulator of viral defense system
MGRSRVMDAGFDKLQEFLLAMAPGDEVSIRHAHELSGLDDDTCETVFAALMRAGLMMRLQEDAYVRVRLAETGQLVSKSTLSSV